MEVLDVQGMRIVEVPEAPAPETVCEVLVVGGGMGGAAAALAAARMGCHVLLAEETDWLGGQMTAQGVSALDEHRTIETFGGTRSYMELRRRIRDEYRARGTLSPEAQANPHLNPGNGWVSALCFEPAAGVAALEAMLAPLVASGRLRVLLRTKAVAVTVTDGRITSVLLLHLETRELWRAHAALVIDATELGDVLPLAGAESVSGAEGRGDTGEPHAREEGPDPECVQSFTYPFAVEYAPGTENRIPPPPDYAENRERQPYTFDHVYYDERGVVTYRMFTKAEKAAGPFWTYRRLIDAAQFTGAATHDVAMINWPGNDFRGANLIDRSPAAALAALRRAKALSLGFLHWLQTEAPRDEGGFGYPELRLRPEVMGTADGLAKFPYIRESRRLRARRTVREQEIAAASQPGARAALFPDSAGVGCYMIDIHPNEREVKIPPQAARPFQIPLGALALVRLRNLLAGAKNIGTTHITNGAYRLHPVEWNVGESAGLLAAFCLRQGVSPARVCDDPGLTRRLQAELVAQGVPLFWYTDLPDGDPAFAAAQLLTTWGIWPAEPEHLLFRPDDTLALEAAQSLIARARDLFPDAPPLPPARLMSRSEWARLLLQAVGSRERV
jgi:FAD dependent oxidoreductase